MTKGMIVKKEVSGKGDDNQNQYKVNNRKTIIKSMPMTVIYENEKFDVTIQYEGNRPHYYDFMIAVGKFLEIEDMDDWMIKTEDCFLIDMNVFSFLPSETIYRLEKIIPGSWEEESLNRIKQN